MTSSSPPPPPPPYLSSSPPPSLPPPPHPPPPPSSSATAIVASIADNLKGLKLLLPWYYCHLKTSLKRCSVGGFLGDFNQNKFIYECLIVVYGLTVR